MPDTNQVVCKRCNRLEYVYTVPLYLPAKEPGNWQTLCGDCFRTVLEVEPGEDLTIQLGKHPRRGRRR
jgi:hypothetical protein